MDDVAVVRSFSRVVTERIGALNDEYLDRGRPLGASRLLWELDPTGTDARDIRSRLDLDSGYLSRLLRALESDALITVAPGTHDARVRVIAPTESGMAERAELDRLADRRAEELLAPLAASQRTRLIDAMGTVARLLTAGLVRLDIEPPDSRDAHACRDAYFAEIAERFEAGFDPARSLPAGSTELVLPHGCLVVARLRDNAVGCGAIQLRGSRPAHIKRMWVSSEARGVGVGRAILERLEAEAQRVGASAVELETNRALPEAIRLYTSAGYVEVEPFNDEPYAHHWFRKTL
jgi:DNA-binding MarR family transcriptional regulator/GNAT superfamily N-acetyltransferase